MKREIKVILIILTGSAFWARASLVALGIWGRGTVSVQPGVASSPGDFLGGVTTFYDIAVQVGGILAIGAIVYGAFKYTLAAGNPSGQSEGKEWIKQALLGLLLLLGALYILRIINPKILTTGVLGQPLPPVTAPSSNPVSACANFPCGTNTHCAVHADGSPYCLPDANPCATDSTCDPATCASSNVCVHVSTCNTSNCPPPNECHSVNGTDQCVFPNSTCDATNCPPPKTCQSISGGRYVCR